MILGITHHVPKVSDLQQRSGITRTTRVRKHAQNSGSRHGELRTAAAVTATMATAVTGTESKQLYKKGII